jgi:hypothetical protein
MARIASASGTANARPAQARHDGKRDLAGLGRQDGVADRPRAARIAQDPPGRERPRRVVEALGLHRPRPKAGRPRLERERDPRRQTAAAAADEDVGLGHALRRRLRRDLEPRRALSGDHLRVVVGLDEREPALPREACADGLPVLAARAVVKDHLRPQQARRVDLEPGASAGMTMTEGTPNSAAARATPCAWLPDEKAITPRARTSGVSADTADRPPRYLKDPVC